MNFAFSDFGCSSVGPIPTLPVIFIGITALIQLSWAQRVLNLSGGNQQKIVVRKWLGTHLKVLTSTSRSAAPTSAPKRKSTI